MTKRRELIDPFGRKIDYLRLSVTDRCNLRCQYCLPETFKDFTVPDNWLTFREITRIVNTFCELGINRVRLTGGEPLLRRDLSELARMLSAIDGLEDLSISSNCIRLEKLAQSLYESGIKRLNVSLDTLDANRFKKITGGGILDKVLRGIEAAQEAGFSPIKINTVLIRGFNDDEIEQILLFCAERGFILRLIETMPIGTSGQNAHSQYINLQDVKKQLEKNHKLIPDILPDGGPARYFRVADLGVHLGLITPISQHFCETCNRVRIAADGNLHLCLGQENLYPLREALRSGISDEGLKNHILNAIALKPERHEFQEKPDKIIRCMATTGG